MSFLSVAHLSGFQEDRLVVNDICFEQSKGQNIAIAGETGSGKTSVLKMIAGLMQPAGGAVYFNEKRVTGPDEQLIAGHPKIAFLSQHFELRNNYKVAELLDMVNKISADEAQKIYTLCDITHLMGRWSDELSGGEKQRIALARLLTGQPELLLLDEPFSNLDSVHKQKIKGILNTIQEEQGISCILVSHDAADILSWAHRVLIMQHGRIIQDGLAKEVYFRPNSIYAAALLGNYNLIDSNWIPELEGMAAPGKKLFLRPQQIQIVDAGSAHVQGRVVKQLFWGNYYSLDIRVQDKLITLQVQHTSAKAGDELHLQFNWQQPCFL